jgi:hypothetical protein
VVKISWNKKRKASGLCREGRFVPEKPAEPVRPPRLVDLLNNALKGPAELKTAVLNQDVPPMPETRHVEPHLSSNRRALQR